MIELLTNKKERRKALFFSLLRFYVRPFSLTTANSIFEERMASVCSLKKV